jgi:hypothetical protein
LLAGQKEKSVQTKRILLARFLLFLSMNFLQYEAHAFIEYLYPRYFHNRTVDSGGDYNS